MDIVLLGTPGVHHLWYVLPLVAAVSLVYAATRHEAMGPILKHAAGCGAWIVGLMVLALALLFFDFVVVLTCVGSSVGWDKRSAGPPQRCFVGEDVYETLVVGRRCACPTLQN